MVLPSQKPGIPGEVISKGNGIIIIILFLILGAISAGLFYWYKLGNIPVVVETTMRPTYETNKEPESTTAKAQVDTLGVMSTSDELGAIEADLESTSLTNLDTELIPIDQELEASFAAE